MNKVEPIRDIRKLSEILEELESDSTWHGQRMFLLFMTLYSTGLRVSDVIRLKKKHVMYDEIETIEKKTGKRQRFPIPQALRDVYAVRLQGMEPDDYIFPSRKRRPDGTKKPITTRQAGYDMEIIRERFNITTPFACHSLRKTHGYMRYTRNHEPIETLRQHFNHADEATTRRYIGIDDDERNKGLLNLPYGGFRPEKPDKRTIRRKKAGEPFEIDRQDNTKQGKAYGNRKRAAAEKAARKKKKA